MRNHCAFKCMTYFPQEKALHYCTEGRFRIYPPLRIPFADGDKVHLAKPMIEGFIDGDELSWEMSLAHHHHISFTIEEAR